MSRKPWSSSKPTNLHLAHSWGGGLGRWVDDFAYADHSSENLVLESFGTIECYGIGLRLTHPASGTTLDSWVLRNPISEVRDSHPEYAAILPEVCDRYGIEHAYVSSLIGHTLDVFRIGVPVTQIHHDYFSFCPAMYIVRDGVCTSCTLDDLKRCKNVDASYRPKNSPHYYLKHRDAYFDAVAAAEVRHVCPSRGLGANLRRLDSRFESIDFTVIEHGVNYRKRDCFGGAEQDRRLRVGLLGHLAWYKGIELVRRLFDTVRVIGDFHFIGCNQGGAEFAGRWGARLVPQYSQEELPAILERDRLDLTLFLPLVPESFSYTLSEAWCFCIPPAARPLGALGERIDDGNDGFLLGPKDDDVIDFLLEADRDRERLRHLAARLRQKPVRTLEDAIRDYYTLRGDDPALRSREER